MDVKKILLFLVILCAFTKLEAQVVINEVSNNNFSQILDEDEESEDWIELYNNSASTVNLEGWTLTDNYTKVDKWPVPSLDLNPGAFHLIYASGKDRRVYEVGVKWQSPVLPSDEFDYIIPTEAISSDWKKLGFDTQSWSKGKAGFGYGDDDDATVVPNGTRVIYIRKQFNIEDLNAIVGAVCHMDYDDGFVAYINGTEIFRANIEGTPTWNSFASALHDPIIESGGLPEAYEFDMRLIDAVLREGENVFAVEVHNRNANSSDLTLIPYLSFKIDSDKNFYNDTPNWLSASSQSNLHTNFKISSGGETVYLFNPQKELVDSLTAGQTLLDHSTGRAKDGSQEIALFDESTPGKSNNTSKAYVDGYEEKPVFDNPAGFYSGAQNITLSKSSANSVIRYTTDGSVPTSTSTLYNGKSIRVSSTQTINARCFGTNKAPGEIATATYFINEDFSIPVLSVTTDRSNLYGWEGIFSNWRESWNKPCYVEYFDEEQQLAFGQKAGIQVDGGAGGSRSRPQTSFRIEPGHGKFGDGDVKYALQPDRPKRKSYSSFYVRNGSNQYLVLKYKDALEVTGLGRNTYNYYSAYRPIVVFINGEYFGVYELREKINDDYLEQNYEMDVDSLDLIGVSYFKGSRLEAIRGSVEPFREDQSKMMRLNPKAYKYLEEVDKFLDINNYTDYIIAQSWIANVDWPGNNIKAFRCKSTDYRWNFAIIDLEWSLRPNHWSTATYDHIQFLKSKGTSNLYTSFWYKMMQNDEYKYYFINRFADLMNTNYSFDVIGELENEMYNEIYPEMDGQFQRWGNSNIQGQLNTFTSNHNIFRSELEIRSSYVREDLQNHYNLDNQIDIEIDVEPKGAGKIKISTITPEEYPWEGIYFSNVPIKIEAIANPGYSFVKWKDNYDIPNTSSAEFTSVFSNLKNSFTANFIADENTFDGVTISEINYKDGDEFNTTDWFEIWNSTSQELNMEGWYFTDDDPEHRFTFEAGTLIPAGERLVVVHNLENFKINYPELTNYTGEFDFKLGTPSDEINLYNSSDELVVSVSYSDIFPWALGEDNSGRTLELINPEANLNDHANWAKGCFMGSPGENFDATCGEINTSAPIAEINENDIVAYPNPANDNVFLQFNLENAMPNTSVNIFDVTGVLVKSNQLGMINANETIKLDISELRANQMYIISVSSDLVQKTFKVIKN